jgi:ATP-dependent Clp protease ATP-binding subunit ClpC
MPELEFNVVALAERLSDELLLAEGLLFPEITCCSSHPGRVRTMLARRIRALVKRLPPGEIYRRRLGERPELRQVSVDVPPVHDDVCRRESVTLAFHYIQWTHGTDAWIAYVPALAIEVLAEDERQLAEFLVPQIRSALARRKSATSVRDLVLLDGRRELQVKRMRLKVKLPTLKQAAQRERDTLDSEKSVLKQVATDLTRTSATPVYERDDLLANMAQCLAARIPRSVLLVGPSGVGKTALVQELARRREDLGLGETPLWSTSGSRLVAGMSGFGMWQERCNKLVREVGKTRAIIHLDNLIELIEVGKGGGNTQGIAAVLRPSIARGELLAIAECTAEQVAIVEREDPRLMDAFTVIEVPEPTPAQMRAILARVAVDVGRRRREEELDRLHRRFATYSAAPGRPLRFLGNLLFDQPRESELTAADVVAAFSQETGLPLLMLDDRLPLELVATRRWLSERVIGQAEPVELVTDLLAATKAGLSRGGKPLASLLFIGPTGVGKTEMAKSLAEFLYQDPGRMIRFDMSEYATSAAVERLIGGPCASQGLLTQKVRDQPFMVVLLDEFEKAHPALFDILLQVLGEGRLTDAAGRVSDFTNSVVIMTSNLGADSFRRGATGFSSGAAAHENAQRHFESATKAFLRPELFNRLDQIVPFAPLDAETIAAIARREIARLAERDGLRLRGVALDVAADVADRLAIAGYDPRYGARPLKRAIERRLVAPLADRLCRQGPQATIDCQARISGGQIVVQTTARPATSAAIGDQRTLALLNDVTVLRRQIQVLERCDVVVRLRNEIERYEQAEQQRLRASRRRGGPTHFSFTATAAQILAQKGLLGRLDALSGDVCQLEDLALGELYDRRPIEAKSIEEAHTQYGVTLREIVFELFAAQRESRDTLTVAVFGAAIDQVVRLVSAYQGLCGDDIVNRYWLKMYDEDLDRGSPGEPKREAPVLRLLSRKQDSEDVPHKVADVFAPAADFLSPPDDVIGLAIAIQGVRASALLETEAGRHEFPRRVGQREVCFVEVQSDAFLKYQPPADVGRASAFRDLPLRRTYDVERELCHDVKLDTDFRLIRGATLHQVVALATAEYLTKRIWSLLD